MRYQHIEIVLAAIFTWYAFFIVYEFMYKLHNEQFEKSYVKSNLKYIELMGLLKYFEILFQIVF